MACRVIAWIGGGLLWGLMLGGVPRPLAAQDRAPFAENAWSRTEVGVGVHLWQAHPEDLFGGPLFIAALEIDPKRDGVFLGLVPAGGFERTSSIGRLTRALAAVNGGFFDRRARNVGVLRVAGEDHGARHPRFVHALALRGGKQAEILHDAAGLFEKEADVLAADPRLLRGGAIPEQLAAKGPRHPRTAAGTTRDGRLLLVVVDGRNERSVGATVRELALIMKALGAHEALNLDGGGSTTLWLEGRPEGGVVNHPSDNRRFDARGERRVANALVVRARPVVSVGLDTARLPEGARWSGEASKGAREAAVPVSFPLVLPREGRWVVRARGAEDARLTMRGAQGEEILPVPMASGGVAFRVPAAGPVIVTAAPPQGGSLRLRGLRAELRPKP